MSDSDLYESGGCFMKLHVDATFRWLDRTCLCNRREAGKAGEFVALNEVSRTSDNSLDTVGV
jgi:hypothetical protein